jgi:flagellar basal body rod protein FlgC
VQPKNPDGTAKGAHNLPNVNLMGGPLVKRNMP